MYLRTTSRRTTSGKVVRYLQLAHNERNERGVPVARVIANLGREDQLDRKALARLVRSISRVLGAREERQALTPEGFEFLRAPELGGPHLIGALWEELGIGRALWRVARASRQRRDVERAIFAMVAQRCLEPASKLEATRWVGRDVALAGVEAVSDDQLYRAMDFLLACQERVQESVFFSVATLLNLEVDVVFFDTTSTYFEMDIEEEEDRDADAHEPQTATTKADQDAPAAPGPLRRLGHSKDHRPDLPQVVIGLAVTREGVPVRVWVWPGNTQDQTVIEEVKRDLSGWRLGRAIYVVDAGCASQKNLSHLREHGGHYIAAVKLRSGMPETEHALSRQGRYRTVADNLKVKQVMVGSGEAATRYVVCHNPHEAARDKSRRERKIRRIEEELVRLEHERRRARGDTAKQAHTKAECALRDHKALGRYVRQTASGRLVLDRQKVATEERLDGKYLITTSDPKLSAEEVALGYKRLLEAERSFRDLKGTLALRPVYHRKDERIRAHVLICFLALVVIRVAELRAGATWRTIRAELGEIRLGHFRSGEGSFTKTTTLTSSQRELLRALGVPEPPSIGSVVPHAAAAA